MMDKIKSLINSLRKKPTHTIHVTFKDVRFASVYLHEDHKGRRKYRIRYEPMDAIDRKKLHKVQDMVKAWDRKEPSLLSELEIWKQTGKLPKDVRPLH